MKKRWIYMCKCACVCVWMDGDMWYKYYIRILEIDIIWLMMQALRFGCDMGKREVTML